MIRRPRQIIPGYHAVREALLRGLPGMEALWIAPGRRSGRVEEILSLARERRIPVVEVQTSELDRNAPGVAHQGVALVAGEFLYTPIEDVISGKPDRRTEKLILVLDHITDEGNFGAIIRTAAFFGVDALVIPRDRSARVTASVMKRASGAHTGIAVSRVVNLPRAIEQMKKSGLWVVGASGGAETPVHGFDWTVPVALVLGNERKGVGPAVRKACDQLVSIPSASPVESLNVSVAAGVLLWEILRQRGG